VAVIERAGRLLVIRRSRHVVAPGMICFPGGGIEGVETEVDALIRELGEELALVVEPVRRLWASVTPWGVELAWWHCHLASDASPAVNPAEVEAFYWYTPHEMRELPDLLESNQQFLAALACGQIALNLTG
jgi:8-oxo-dGTP diphosphatase